MCRRESRRLTDAANSLRPVAVPDCANHRPGWRLVDAARDARGIRRPPPLRGFPARAESSARSARAQARSPGRRRPAEEGRLRRASAAFRIPPDGQGPRVLGRARRDVRWGSDWLWGEDGPPVILIDAETGSEVR